MTNGNGTPDFNEKIEEARQTGNFDFVLQTAKNSKKMLVDFRDAIRAAQFQGCQSACVAMGLNFLEGMIQNADQQLQLLKQTEKATRDAIQTAGRGGVPPEPEVLH